MNLQTINKPSISIEQH